MRIRQRMEERTELRSRARSVADDLLNEILKQLEERCVGEDMQSVVLQMLQSELQFAAKNTGSLTLPPPRDFR